MRPEDVAPLWAAALMDHRDDINAAVAEAVADGADPALIKQALRSLGPSFDRHCGPIEPHRRSAWAAALAHATVDACGQHQWSQRTLTPWTLTEFVTRLARYVAPAAGTAEAVVYAANQLSRAGDVEAWVRFTLDAIHADHHLAGLADGDRLRRICAITAWRAGHVRMRAAALAQPSELPASTLAAAVGIGDMASAADILDTNRGDPTFWIGSETASAAHVPLRRIGGFRAFGGPWVHPPRILDGDGLHWQIDAGNLWAVIADVHGAAVVPAGPGTAGPSPGHQVVRGRAVLVSTPYSYQLIHARAGSLT